MFEKLVIIPRKKTNGERALNIVLFALACICLVLAIFFSPKIFFLPSLLLVLVWGWQTFSSYTEYEYTYFDGDLRFARIKNRARRKRIAEINMENVILIAPRGDRSVYKYENDKSLSYKNLSSGEEGARVYELICKGDKKLVRYEFEPDEEMLDEMCIKYARIITK